MALLYTQIKALEILWWKQSSSLMNRTEYTEPGQYKIEFEFNKLPLATGRYKLIAAIHNHDITRTIDINTESYYFDLYREEDMNNFDEDIMMIQQLCPS